MRAVRVIAPGFAIAFAVLAACGGDDSSNGSSGGPQPSACPPTPCTVGAICYQPAPNENCNGSWYCWTDTMWHCAPQDAGGPSDATVTFESSTGDDGGSEAGDDGPATTDAEAGPTGG